MKLLGMKLSLIWMVAIFAILMLGGCAGIPRHSQNGAEESPFMIKNGDKVVFYGDSITDGQWYPTFIRAFVATRHPEWRNTFLNRGVSGNRTSSLKRFERDVVEQKPDVALFMMGYNDLRYGKLSSKWLETFLGNVEESILMLRTRSPKTKLLLVSPPLKNTVVSNESCLVSPKSSPYSLLMLDREEKKLAGKMDVPFLDMGTLYGRLIGLGEVVGQETFALSLDGVHSQQEGQLFLAYFMLQKMDAGGGVASATLDAVNATVENSEKCSVTKVNWSCEGNFVFERRCEVLPFPIPPSAKIFAFLADVDDNLNRDMLRVTRLDSKSYDLKIDGNKIATLRADELSKGVNLSRFVNTPMYQQSLKLLAAARKLDELETKIFLLIRAGKLDGFGKVTNGTPAELKQQLPAIMKKIESAKLAMYSLNKARLHKFALSPNLNVPDRFAALVDNPLNQSHLKFKISPVNVNANLEKLRSSEITLVIFNQNRTSKTGSLKWDHTTNWSIKPEIAKFAVPANGKINLKFKLICSEKVDVSIAPKLEVRWKWSTNWYYPRIETLSIPFVPTLSIPK